MKAKFLEAFRTDLERYCDHMSHEAKENILSFGLPTRLYSRFTLDGYARHGSRSENYRLSGVLRSKQCRDADQE